jgi:hypothetical protein
LANNPREDHSTVLAPTKNRDVILPVTVDFSWARLIMVGNMEP